MIFGINLSPMTWFFYLNYKVFNFYRRKRDSMPALFSFLATMVLVSFNIFSILGISGLFINSVHSFILGSGKFSILILYAFIGIFNYVALYRGARYEEVFAFFDKNEVRYKKWNLSVTLYILGSIVAMLAMLVLADLVNHGHLSI